MLKINKIKIHTIKNKNKRYLITGSLDNTCRVWSSQPEKKDGFVPVSLVGHKDNVVACFFGEGGSVAYSIAKDCVVFVWKWVKDQPSSSSSTIGTTGALSRDLIAQGGGGDLDLNIKYGRWELHSKHFLWEPPQASSGETGIRPKKKRKNKHGKKGISSTDDNGDGNEASEASEAKHQVSLKVRCAEFHKKSNLLAIGLSNGTFSLFEMDFILGGFFTSSSSSTSVLTPLHTLSISQADVGTVAINGSGEWLAFGASSLGQLLVWEWQSESYILKQQGHSYDMNALAFSPDGSVIATGADDNKVKLWSASSGFCYATFNDHTAPVTGVVFGPATGRVVLTSSLDGTVRAYDLLRYKNFRTLASPDPVQFSCLAIDSSGEVVVAGSMDPFQIFVWALQTGNLLDVLSGHEGPISSLAFDISSGHLASGSWDNTVKIWNVWNNECLDTLRHPASVLAIAYRPDGKQLTAATLHGQVLILLLTFIIIIIIIIYS
jgi:periodic tryptophan protein 2